MSLAGPLLLLTLLLRCSVEHDVCQYNGSPASGRQWLLQKRSVNADTIQRTVCIRRGFRLLSRPRRFVDN